MNNSSVLFTVPSLVWQTQYSTKCHTLYCKHSPDYHADATNYWRLASEYAQFLVDYICLGGETQLHNHGRWTLMRSIGHFICAHARDSRPLQETNGRGWSCDFVQRLRVTLQAVRDVSVAVLALTAGPVCSLLRHSPG